MNLTTRFRIVGFEVVGVGAFVFVLLFLELRESNGNPTVASFGWVFAIIGITLILVGLETLSLTRRLFDEKESIHQPKGNTGKS